MKKLDEIKGKSPFRVPENYFKEVNRKIMDSASGYTSETKAVSRHLRIMPLLRIAALIAGFIMASYLLLRTFEPLGRDEAGLQEFPETYLNDIDLGTLEEAGSGSVLSDEVPEVSKSEIINYLLMDDVKINEIYEQL